MKKNKIYALGREENFLFIKLNKKKDFFSWLSQLLFSSFKIYNVSTCDYENKNGKYTRRKKYIKEFVDKHESYFGNKNERVDIFYGKNSVFLVLNANKKSTKKFLNNLEKVSEWVKKETLHNRVS